MLSYTLRMMGHIGKAAVKSHIGFDECDVMHMRAWPWVCDYNAHVNNAEYLTLMDWGRTHWTTRTGFGRVWLKDRIGVVVAGSSIVYRRPINLMEPYTLHTKLDSVDGRWVYVAQTFFNAKGELAVRALVRLAMSKNGQPYPFENVVDATGFTGVLPALTREAAALGESSSAGLSAASEIGGTPTP